MTGTGSTWTNSFDLWVGENGTGTFNVSNGGTVSNGEGCIGCNFGADGTANVDGAGSTWTTGGFFYVGENGSGVLNITNDGQVNSNGSFCVHLMGRAVAKQRHHRRHRLAVEQFSGSLRWLQWSRHADHHQRRSHDKWDVR